MEVVQAPAQGDSSADEEDEEEGEADIEDSQILEDLPDETEVRYLSTSLFSTWRTTVGCRIST